MNEEAPRRTVQFLKKACFGGITGLVAAVEARARAHAVEMGSGEQELVRDAIADVSALNEFSTALAARTSA